MGGEGRESRKGREKKRKIWEEGRGEEEEEKRRPIGGMKRRVHKKAFVAFSWEKKEVKEV